MGAGGEAKKSLEGRHRGPSSIEAEGELVEVGLEMAVADTMVSTAEPRLEVAKDAMDVRQELRGSLRSALRARAMAVAQIYKRGIGGPAIRQDRGSGSGGALDETGQRAPRGIRHDLEPYAAGGLASHFHRAHDQRLFQQLTPALQARLMASQVGLVDLDLIPERLSLWVHHGPAELVQERPGRLVAQSELALQLHRRQPRCVSGHQVRGPKPDRQRHPRPMQDRARRHGRLPIACLALPQSPARQLEGARRSAVRAAKALGPAARRQVRSTPLVVRESGLKLFQRLGEIRPAHAAILRMGSFGINPIGSSQLISLCRTSRSFVVWQPCPDRLSSRLSTPGYDGIVFK